MLKVTREQLASSDFTETHCLPVLDRSKIFVIASKCTVPNGKILSKQTVYTSLNKTYHILCAIKRPRKMK